MADHVTVYFEAYACDEHGDSPAFARLNVDVAFLARVGYLGALVQGHRLASVTTYDGPDAWDLQDELRLGPSELVVHGGDFWFQTYPKGVDYRVETRMVDIRSFTATVAEALESDTEPKALYFGNHPDELKRRVDETERTTVEEACHG
jgi:hypothetical protein